MGGDRPAGTGPCGMPSARVGRRPWDAGAAPEAMFPESGTGNQLRGRGSLRVGLQPSSWGREGLSREWDRAVRAGVQIRGEGGRTVGTGPGSRGRRSPRVGSGIGVPASGAGVGSGMEVKRCPRVGPERWGRCGAARAGPSRGCEVRAYLPRVLVRKGRRRREMWEDFMLYPIQRSGPFFAP